MTGLLFNGEMEPCWVREFTENGRAEIHVE